MKENRLKTQLPIIIIFILNIIYAFFLIKFNLCFPNYISFILGIIFGIIAIFFEKMINKGK